MMELDSQMEKLITNRSAGWLAINGRKTGAGSEELVVGMRPATSKLMMFTVLQRSAARYQSGHLRHSRVIKQCMLLL